MDHRIKRFVIESTARDMWNDRRAGEFYFVVDSDGSGDGDWREIPTWYSKEMSERNRERYRLVAAKRLRFGAYDPLSGSFRITI